ncbi:hypothetical protein [Hydrocarboniphaga effusa]|uniref:hypothetical protein n=1 Tax=Hydrocarboniphaga effusa TaxID=243629 RepID=UPI003BAA2140
MYNPEIFVSMTATMQCIQKFVSSRNYYYVTGIVPAAKAAMLVNKFDERFHLRMSDGQRDTARKRGRCSFHLVLFPLTGRTDFTFWLLRNAGTHPLLDSERWLDARETPITWPFLYELRQIPVPPVLRTKYKRKDGSIAINPVTWTWRFKREELVRIRGNVRHWAGCRDERMERLVRGLGVAPGFRAIRDDVFQLMQYINLQRVKRNAAPMELPFRRWVSGKRSQTVPLSYLLGRVSRHAETWFPPHVMRMDTVKIPELIGDENVAA